MRVLPLKLFTKFRQSGIEDISSNSEGALHVPPPRTGTRYTAAGAPSFLGSLTPRSIPPSASTATACSHGGAFRQAAGVNTTPAGSKRTAAAMAAKLAAQSAHLCNCPPRRAGDVVPPRLQHLHGSKEEHGGLVTGNADLSAGHRKLAARHLRCYMPASTASCQPATQHLPCPCPRGMQSAH